VQLLLVAPADSRDAGQPVKSNLIHIIRLAEGVVSEPFLPSGDQGRYRAGSEARYAYQFPTSTLCDSDAQTTRGITLGPLGVAAKGIGGELYEQSRTPLNRIEFVMRKCYAKWWCGN
jgi:hypothetical protein